MYWPDGVADAGASFGPREEAADEVFRVEGNSGTGGACLIGAGAGGADRLGNGTNGAERFGRGMGFSSFAEAMFCVVTGISPCLTGNDS